MMVLFSVQLLNKLCIRAADSSQKLLKVVKNPVHIHLPPGCLKFGTSFNATHLSNIHDIVPKVDLPPVPIVFVVGAIARGAVCHMF
jgi:rRNA small subunit pseudouridine methyltransferase Nep1